MTTVLLGMDNQNADIFRESLEQYSDGKLKVAVDSVPILHNAKKAIELSRPTPDIFLIAMNHISFDTPDHENELLETLSSLKMANNSIRLAVQADIHPNDPFLKKIALLQITDIFPGSQHNPEEFDMAQVAIQLSKPANVNNIYKYYNLPSEDAGDAYLNDNLGIGKSNSEGAANERKLKKLVNTLIAQNEQLKKRTGVNTVPRKDYDELVNSLRTIQSSSITTDSLKATVGNILKVNQETTEDLKKVTNINRDLNNSIVDLMENNNDDEVTSLKQENEKLSHELEIVRKRNYKNNDANGRAAPNNAVSKKRKGKTGRKPLLLILVIIILAVAFGGPALAQHIRPNNIETEQPAKPTFNSLIKAGNYDTAAKYYPKRAVAAENAMLADTELSDKADMARKILVYSSNDVIKFDNDYFEQKYEEATDIYKNSAEPDLTDLTKERRVMAAYCLMKTGNIVDAKSTAKPLNNDNLNKRIEVFAKFYNANKILNNKIQNDHLSEKEEKRAREQIRKNQEAMDKL